MLHPTGFITASTADWLDTVGENIDAKMELAFRTEPRADYKIPFFLHPQFDEKTIRVLRDLLTMCPLELEECCADHDTSAEAIWCAIGETQPGQVIATASN